MLVDSDELSAEGSRIELAADGPEFSIVVPTYKERANVAELVARLRRVLAGIHWEVIFVDDDSPDGTADAVRELGRVDRRVRCLQRVGRRGLSSACVEGMLASSAPYVAVMDADLQHDESLLPDMLRALRTGDVDVVVGSRYVAGGGVGNWDASRLRKSRFATRLARFAVKVPLSDPMSGFFALRSEVLHDTVRHLSAIGFKILLDILASSAQGLRVRELPYQFRERIAGESKLDSKVAWDYLMLILDKTLGRFIPVRFVVFMMVGGLGVFVHLAVLTSMFKLAGSSFLSGQSVATLVAMTFNFIVNNVFTYRDRRLSGWGWLWGWITFVLACSVGALANVGIATYLFQEEKAFWVLSAIAGIVVGAVWNYAVTSIYTWKST
ncbi:glycosyltransferase family 2 protein [Methylotetracoccus oryzae]|uniref:glycosyltransferase family 2 protein n=1 Tax=Methylotetracoccus oryzae TaxID=1919059 RepID=UPI00111A357E|nr:glycosyltransferase family 2 protein [Methylotetracoccus oryzae]